MTAPPGVAVASGIPPTAIIWSALLPPLAEALRQLDRITSVRPDAPPDHHDLIELYTHEGVVLVAFVIAIYQLLRRLDS